MNGSPYVLASLAATRAGIPDPTLEVDVSLSQLQDVLDLGVETAHEAYELLAQRARLRRVRPELIHQLQGAPILARADAVLADMGRDLAADALAVPNPAAWLAETSRLQAAYDEPATPEDRSTLAERLLTDLDDADLVLCEARRLGRDDRELDTELTAAHDWLAKHAEMFLAASVHVQAVGLTLRPDLAECDYALAATVLKYLDLLRAAEAAERQLALDLLQPFPATATQRVAAEFRQQRDDRIRALQAAFIAWTMTVRKAMRPRPLARAAEETPLPPLQWWEWSDPAGELVARLTVPPEPVQDEPVFLEFVGADRQRATQLAEQPVMLNGVEGRIDSDGQAAFALGRLLETDQPLELRVGADEMPWRLKWK